MSRNPSVFLTYAGLTLSASDWASLFGYNASTLHNRVRAGQSAEAALLRPVGPPVAPRKGPLNVAERRAERIRWHAERG